MLIAAPDPVPLLTREQASIRLAIDPDSVSLLISSGQLKAVNVAKSRNAKRPTWRIRPEDLAEFELIRSTIKPPSNAKPRTPKRTGRKRYFST